MKTLDETEMEEITIWSETKKGGKVVERFPSNATNIDLNGRRIATTDLEVLKSFSNIEALTLSGNEIQSIDLNPLRNCEMLLELSLNRLILYPWRVVQA